MIDVEIVRNIALGVSVALIFVGLIKGGINSLLSSVGTGGVAEIWLVILGLLLFGMAAIIGA